MKKFLFLVLATIVVGCTSDDQSLTNSQFGTQLNIPEQFHGDWVGTSTTNDDRVLHIEQHSFTFETQSGTVKTFTSGVQMSSSPSQNNLQVGQQDYAFFEKVGTNIMLFSYQEDNVDLVNGGYVRQ